MLNETDVGMVMDGFRLLVVTVIWAWREAVSSPYATTRGTPLMPGPDSLCGSCEQKSKKTFPAHGGTDDGEKGMQ